ncbi:GNAT family N-acetyltransferase [Demequina sp. NBRC 110057]|uniref:GNAT family N-acetyltransferase n=1 Tax=Demequina sp. NBRC 110057 TaxID=1570346 RepID=UPI000A07BE32|nr:GNAT family N-acetyltransferase [Demequina sp. NBRC 110057]
MTRPADGTPAVIRRATPDDAAAIARMHVQSWRESYGAELPAGALDDVDLDARAARWADTLRLDDVHTYVATVADAVVGFANASEGRDDDAPVARELEGLYVLAAHQRGRLGTRLLTAAIGAGDAYLWVWTGNRHALAFYRAHGFSFEGAVKEVPLAGHPMEVARMVRESAYEEGQVSAKPLA